MAERLQEIAKKKDSGEDEIASRGALLTNFLKAQRENSAFFTDSRVLTMATSIALAGSDTTAISLSAVFYHILKNVRCYQKLNEEIDDAIRSGLIEDTEGIISWPDAQKLPYLDACIKEAFRVHPAIGLNLERVVPPQGMEICDHFIPSGTIVSCNAWVLHRRREIFGEDVDVYRPERWLVDPSRELQAEQLRLKEMNATMFHFGAGSRTWLGKHIGLLEMYKLIPSFLRRFEVSPLSCFY